MLLCNCNNKDFLNFPYFSAPKKRMKLKLNCLRFFLLRLSLKTNLWKRFGIQPATLSNCNAQLQIVVDSYGQCNDLVVYFQVAALEMVAVQVDVQVLAFELAQGLAADMEAAPQVETIFCPRLNSR